MRVTVRPAVIFPDMIHPKRVAAYCRVNTEQEIQYHSLEIQKKYFTDEIGAKVNWISTSSMDTIRGLWNDLFL